MCEGRGEEGGVSEPESVRGASADEQGEDRRVWEGVLASSFFLSLCLVPSPLLSRSSGHALRRDEEGEKTQGVKGGKTMR